MLTLTEAKLHCRIDHDDEDSLIQGMIDAAAAATADYLNMDPEQLTTTVPSPIKCAALMLVGDLYEHRESQVDLALYENRTYERLLNPYRAMDV